MPRVKNEKMQAEEQNTERERERERENFYYWNIIIFSGGGGE